MNFSQQKHYLNSIGNNVLSTFEKDYFNESNIQNEDEIIEHLIDHIIQNSCMFHFKVPLGEDYYQAKNYALNAFDCLPRKNFNGKQNIIPRKVSDWIRNVIKCLDRLLIVYLYDVKEKNIDGEYFSNIKERDIYRTFENLGGDLKIIGEKCNAIYSTRSNLEHDLMKKIEGRLVFKKKSSKLLNRSYEFVNDNLTDIFNILVPLYKEHFPEHCKK